MGDWKDQAACRGRTDLTWFPHQESKGGRSLAYRRVIAAAQEVCDTCPVRVECRTAGQHEADGIWGGVHVSARSSAPVSVHGTETGYRQHYKRGEEPCDECRDVHLANKAAKAAERRAAASAAAHAAKVAAVRKITGRTG
jgi:hypothetical protein